MSKETTKIILAIFLALLITKFLSEIFLGASPRINRFFLANLFSKKITPTPMLAPTPTISEVFLPAPTVAPTLIFPSPTSTPIPTPSRAPTLPPANTACPTTSNQTYSSLPTTRSGADMPLYPPVENSPEINLRLRGFVDVNESATLISRNGDTTGLDPQMPPQISSLYGGAAPQIIKTYRIYEWDFQNNKSAAPQTATPNFKVHMLGLAATAGQPLLGLRAGREIGNGNVFMVLYATKNDITFTHSNSDSLLGGYLFYFLDICVDPNLLTLYQQDNAAGRGNLPVIATGQVFGTAKGAEVKIVVRDTMSFMDTRYKEDWWEWKPWQ